MSRDVSTFDEKIGEELFGSRNTMPRDRVRSTRGSSVDTTVMVFTHDINDWCGATCHENSLVAHPRHKRNQGPDWQDLSKNKSHSKLNQVLVLLVGEAAHDECGPGTIHRPSRVRDSKDELHQMATTSCTDRSFS